jgi:hypothetical protein
MKIVKAQTPALYFKAHPEKSKRNQWLKFPLNQLHNNLDKWRSPLHQPANNKPQHSGSLNTFEL